MKTKLKTADRCAKCGRLAKAAKKIGVLTWCAACIRKRGQGDAELARLYRLEQAQLLIAGVEGQL